MGWSAYAGRGDSEQNFVVANRLPEFEAMINAVSREQLPFTGFPSIDLRQAALLSYTDGLMLQAATGEVCKTVGSDHLFWSRERVRQLHDKANWEFDCEALDDSGFGAVSRADARLFLHFCVQNDLAILFGW